jgi:hypothetical protein
MSTKWEMPRNPSTVGAWVVVVAMYAVVILCYPASFAIDAKTFRRLGWEGGIETTGAMLFLVASVGFLTLFICSSAYENSLFGRRTRRNLFLGLLAVIMFICFGEEISWGQRFLGFQTPQFLTGLNAQNETNLHNIWLVHQWQPDGSEKSFLGLLLNMNRLFSIFWLTYFVVVPISAKRSERVRRALIFAGIPIPPIWAGGLFLATYFSYKTTAAIDAGSIRAHSLDELKESTYAAIYAFFAMFSLAAMAPKLKMGRPRNNSPEGQQDGSTDTNFGE